MSSCYDLLLNKHTEKYLINLFRIEIYRFGFATLQNDFVICNKSAPLAIMVQNEA